MFTVDRRCFDEWVEEAWLQVPSYFRTRIKNVSIEVEEGLAPRRKSPGGQLLGLYVGVPLPERTSASAETPDRIILYKANLEAISSSAEDLKEQIRQTLWHELGHYFGMDEKRLRRRGY
jgi:predicted Zn-dependent protease with MMP-like domain